MERINFTAKDGTIAALDSIAGKNNRNRSQQILALIEPHLTIARKFLKVSQKLNRNSR